MEQVLVILILALVVYAAYKWLSKKDQNDDGKVDWQDGVEAAKSAVVDVKDAVVNVADVNKDGKVDLADAAEVVAKVKKGRKKKAS
jgi:flagellar basal body-associated protein FliL